MSNPLILFNLLFLLLLLIPSGNSIGEILNQIVTPEELAAVDGDISAVYIIRAIDERAEEFEILKNQAKRKIHAHGKNVKPDEQLFHDSTLTDPEMKTLTGGLATALEADYKKFTGGLIMALKADTKINYGNLVEQHIKNFKKTTPTKIDNLIAKGGTRVKSLMFGREQPVSLVEMCKQLHEGHVDFLEQIKLETKLHFWSFNFADFEANKEKILKSYKYLLDLNTATENVHRDIVAVLKSPQKIEEKSPQKIEGRSPQNKADKFAISLMEIAQKAKSETHIPSNGETPYGKLDGENYLRKIFAIARAVPKLRILTEKIGPEEISIDEKIRKKLEMPREWYERMYAQANPMPRYENETSAPVTDQVRNALIVVVVAQTLLVYERLNKFYKIDHHYKTWVKKQMPEEDHLLNSYFNKFGGRKEENKQKPTAGAASPAVGHVNHTVANQPELWEFWKTDY